MGRGLELMVKTKDGLQTLLFSFSPGELEMDGICLKECFVFFFQQAVDASTSLSSDWNKNRV